MVCANITERAKKETIRNGGQIVHGSGCENGKGVAAHSELAVKAYKALAILQSRNWKSGRLFDDYNDVEALHAILKELNEASDSNAASIVSLANKNSALERAIHKSTKRRQISRTYRRFVRECLRTMANPPNPEFAEELMDVLNNPKLSVDLRVYAYNGLAVHEHDDPVFWQKALDEIANEFLPYYCYKRNIDEMRRIVRWVGEKGHVLENLVNQQNLIKIYEANVIGASNETQKNSMGQLRREILDLLSQVNFADKANEPCLSFFNSRINFHSPNDDTTIEVLQAIRRSGNPTFKDRELMIRLDRIRQNIYKWQPIPPVLAEKLKELDKTIQYLNDLNGGVD